MKKIHSPATDPHFSRKLKTRSLRKSATMANSRWAAYAAAGAASALGCASSAEADITYSGLINRPFADTNPGGPGGADYGTFGLAPNASFGLFHGQGATTQGAPINQAAFLITGVNSGMFRGVIGPGGSSFRYVSRLASNVNVSLGNFVAPFTATYFATLALSGGSFGQVGNFRDAGIGFIGFSFDSGSGTQYGWARVNMNGSANANTFTLIDYAFAGPGEQIATGQIPEPATLAFLALGGVGLLAWRKWRAEAAS